MEGLLERKAARRERMWLNVCWGERWDLKGALHQSKMRIKTQAGGSVRHGQKSRARHGARTKTAWDKWIKAASGSRRNQVWKQQWFLIYWRWIWGGWFCLKHHDCVVWPSALHWHVKTETNMDKVIWNKKYLFINPLWFIQVKLSGGGLGVKTCRFLIVQSTQTVRHTWVKVTISWWNMTLVQSKNHSWLVKVWNYLKSDSL